MAPPIRDRALIDALEHLARLPYSRTIWRSVRDGRGPMECARAGGRWDDRTFDVLYTSEAREGAIEELRFHLFRGQPIPPSKVRYRLFELVVELSAVIAFDELAALASIGMDTSNYGRASYSEKDVEYPRSQEIAEACFFLGADGTLVPGARHDSRNLVVFCDQEPRPTIEIVRDHGLIDWADR
jgi:RES domain-containing protein